MLGRFQPLLCDRLELVVAHAGMGGSNNLGPILLGKRRQRARITRKHRLEWLFGFPFRVRRSERPYSVEREHRLGEERVLDPQCAVLIEGGDAILGRHVALTGLVGCDPHEIDNRLLSRAIVP